MGVFGGRWRVVGGFSPAGSMCGRVCVVDLGFQWVMHGNMLEKRSEC